MVREIRFHGPLPEAIRHLDETAPPGLHCDASDRDQLRVVIIEVLAGGEKRFLIEEQS